MTSELEIEIEQLLAIHADSLSAWAVQNCAGGIMDQFDCSWYHAVWPYLRIADAVSAPTRHFDFFSECLGLLKPEKTALKILISGCADFSMLAVVRASLVRHGMTATISILDGCDSPLEACRRYGDLTNLTVETIRANILGYQSRNDDCYDFICTDAFLTRFAEPDATEVLRRWHSMLSPNGRLVTTIRLHSHDVHGEGSENEFSKRVTLNLERKGYTFHRSSEEIGDMAFQYAERMRSNNLGTAQSIERCFSLCGFTLLQAVQAQTKGELHDEATYLRVCATRN